MKEKIISLFKKINLSEQRLEMRIDKFVLVRMVIRKVQ